MKTIAAAVLALLLPAGLPAARASITITSNRMFSSAYDGVGDSTANAFTGTTIPTSPSPFILQATDGISSSKTTLNWSESGGQTVLSFGFEHQRGGLFLATAQSIVNSLYFTANANESYALSGVYTVADGGSTGSGNVMQRAYLYDHTAGTALFDGVQQSQNTRHEQFTLGGSGGDFDNSLPSGSSLTGNLIAGHSYQLLFNAVTQVFLENNNGASAS